MDIDPVKEYISSYSSRRYQEVNWQEVTPGWLGIYRAVEWADPPVLEYLKDLKFATCSQLLKHFYISQVNGKKRIERMARTGILLRHSLVNNIGDTAIYTLGPLGSELVRERWVPNWWRPFSLVDCLKRLVTNQDLVGGQFSQVVMYRFEDGAIVPEDLFGEPVAGNDSMTN